MITWRIDPSNGPVGSPCWKSVKTAHDAMKTGRPPGPPRYLKLRMLAWSCPGCGQLRTIPDNLLHNGSGIVPPCRTCANKSVQKTTKKRIAERDPRYVERRKKAADRSRKRIQAETLEAAHHYHQHYTTTDLTVLEDESLTAQEVAWKLGRTVQAVRAKRQSMKITCGNLEDEVN